MASKNSNKRKSTNKSKTTSKRKRTNNRKRSYTTKEEKQNQAQKALIRDEIILILTFVLSLLMLLSNFDLSGKVGKSINRVTFGLFGFIGYLMPLVLFCLVIFLVANRGNKIAYRKTISSSILVATFAALIQLISSKHTVETISSYYEISALDKSGGGVIGGVIVNLIHPLFGTVGSYVIIIGIMLICFLLLTGKAFLTYLGKRGRSTIKGLKEEVKLSRQGNGTRTNNQKRDKSKAKERTSKKETRASSFLLKDKFKSLTFGGNKTDNDAELKQELDDSQDVSMNKQGQGQQVFSMEEIQGKDNGDKAKVNNLADKDNMAIDIAIHRTDSYPEEDSVEDKVDFQEEIGLAHDLEENPTREGPADLLNENDGKLDPVTANDTLMEEQKLPDQSNFSEASEGGQAAEVTAKKTSPKNTTATGDLEELKIEQTVKEEIKHVYPTVNLLAKPKKQTKGVSDKVLKDTAIKLQETLESFGVGVTVTNVSCGPTVTRYEIQPEQGVKVSKITSLSDDIKLNLAVSDIRIEAPIPGKAAVGIEVPNTENSIVTLREMIESKEFDKSSSKLSFATGKDIGGRNIIADISKMPHLLIAGATGSGKSVCINSIIMSILYNAKPSEVRLILIDPKIVELNSYNGIPHLLLPVVTDPKKAASALNWGVNEMTDRYKKFADLGVRDLEGYNEKVKNDKTIDEKYEKLPQILIIVDELADLMMVASTEVEDAICRLAQMARAAGIHLIIATQRPSVNVITGVIKANIPSRIAFSVSSAVDSRTILDSAGAEKLLGKGDMLYYPSGYSKPLRVQGAFVSDLEINRVVEAVIKNNGGASYNKKVEKEIISTQSSMSSVKEDYLERDEYFSESGRFIIDKDKASIGMLQRVFRIGFNRAARIMDQLHHAGAVGPEEGTKPRQIIMTAEEFEAYLKENEIM